MARIKSEERQQILDQTRLRLLEAAAEEFARVGYSDANINTISTSAGFAKGTVYNYFSSKRALLLAVSTLLPGSILISLWIRCVRSLIRLAGLKASTRLGLNTLLTAQRERAFYSTRSTARMKP